MRKFVGIVLLLVVVLFGLSFALLNANPINVDYYLGETTLPLSLALAIALVIGAVLGVIAMLGIVTRQRRELMQQRRRLNQAEQELSELRKLPIKDAA